MSSATEFNVLLVGTEVLADRMLHRHLKAQYAVRHVAGARVDVDLMIDNALTVNPALRSSRSRPTPAKA